MPRPKSKTELLELSQKNFDLLNDFISSLPKDRQTKTFPPGTLNRNIRDVMAHLHHWHLMFLEWYEIGMAGAKPVIPAEGYTWKTTPELNRKIWKDYAQIDLNEIRKRFNRSHKTVYKLIEQHSDEELFEKKRYKWTGSTSLGAYLISATSSHYDWGLKLIKKAFK